MLNTGSSPFIRKDKLYPLLDEIIEELEAFMYVLEGDGCYTYASQISDLIKRVKEEFDYDS